LKRLSKLKQKRMKIKYNDTEFEIKNDRLAVRKAATPLIVKYRQLRTEYMSDIDKSFITEYDKQIKKYQTVLEQIEGKDGDVEEGKTYAEYRIEMDEKLKQAIDNKNADERVSIIQQEENEIESLIYLQLICYTDLMYKLYEQLIGDIKVINVNDDNYETFALEVLAGFFGISFARILESQNLKKTTN